MVLFTVTRLLIVLVFLCFSVCRQESFGLAKLDVSVGYSYVHVSSSSTSGLGSQSVNGADASASYQLKPWLRLVADFGLASAGYRSSDIIGIQLWGTQSTYLLGPRFVLPLGHATPFAQVLFGVAHANAGMFDAWALGGGFDYQLTPHFALRPIQLEFLRTNLFELQNSKLAQSDFRALTGVVFRF